ncbi:MAG: hypothetical protein RI591_03710 [Dehalococcoidia bacterium]|nr:hypothetical protein [Dehalococcoidia bacterium]
MDHILAWLVVFVIMALTFIVARRFLKLSTRLLAFTIIAIFAIGAIIIYLVVF